MSAFVCAPAPTRSISGQVGNLRAGHRRPQKATLTFVSTIPAVPAVPTVPTPSRLTPEQALAKIQSLHTKEINRLEAWLRHAGNVRAAAKELGESRNTVAATVNLHHRLIADMFPKICLSE